MKPLVCVLLYRLDQEKYFNDIIDDMSQYGYILPYFIPLRTRYDCSLPNNDLESNKAVRSNDIPVDDHRQNHVHGSISEEMLRSQPYRRNCSV